MVDKDSIDQWHEYFYYVLQELLTPVGLTVETELPVNVKSPKIDVIIIRRETERWTLEQLERLPDGIRHSNASHILLEFKYTESFNENVIYQIAQYDVNYRKSQQLNKKHLQSFLVISKTPRKSVLAKYDYKPTKYKGVYKSSNVLSMRFPMLVLNKLGDEPYNVYFKLFASKLAAKREAAKTLEKEIQVKTLSKQLIWFLDGLLALWLSLKGENEMIIDFTPEQMVEVGKVFKEFILPRMPPEERLAGMPPEERLAGMPPEERLAGMLPEERLAGMLPEERLAGMPLEERLAGTPLEEWLASIPLEHRLADIPLDKISENELEKIPFVNRIEEKGIEKGEQKATIEALKQIITLRFKGESGQFEEELTTLSLTTLKRLTEVALTVENLTEFEQALVEIETEG